MNNETLKSLFDSFNQYSILIIGDVMLDSYMWGDVNRISPEAPVPIVSITKSEIRLGGAANVALNVRAMGAKAILASVIGNDEKGSDFMNLLNKRDLSKIGIIKSDKRTTTVKHRIISSGQHLLRVDRENSENLSEDIETLFIKNTISIIENQKLDAIIFEDYDKGCITPQVIESIVSIANSKKVPVSVDPKKRNFNNYTNVDLFKPNFKELCMGMKMDINMDDYAEINNAATKFQKKTNANMILVTLSELGVFISQDGEYYRIPTDVRVISDVSGAGDTVISIATLCLVSNLKFEEIARISNIAGGLVCEKVGVVPIDKEQLLIKCDTI